jgi:hypothetical protein
VPFSDLSVFVLVYQNNLHWCCRTCPLQQDNLYAGLAPHKKHPKYHTFFVLKSTSVQAVIGHWDSGLVGHSHNCSALSKHSKLVHSVTEQWCNQLGIMHMLLKRLRSVCTTSRCSSCFFTSSDFSSSGRLVPGASPRCCTGTPSTDLSSGGSG